jgi:hypothetical protein
VRYVPNQTMDRVPALVTVMVQFVPFGDFSWMEPPFPVARKPDCAYTVPLLMTLVDP